MAWWPTYLHKWGNSSSYLTHTGVMSGLNMLKNPTCCLYFLYLINHYDWFVGVCCNHCGKHMTEMERERNRSFCFGHFWMKILLCVAAVWYEGKMFYSRSDLDFTKQEVLLEMTWNMKWNIVRWQWHHLGEVILFSEKARHGGQLWHSAFLLLLLSCSGACYESCLMKTILPHQNLLINHYMALFGVLEPFPSSFLLDWVHSTCSRQHQLSFVFGNLYWPAVHPDDLNGTYRIETSLLSQRLQVHTSCLCRPLWEYCTNVREI